MSSYEEQLENRIEQLERHLQESEKQECRDFQKLKKVLIKHMDGIPNYSKVDQRDVIFVADRKLIESLEDPDIREAHERHKEMVDADYNDILKSLKAPNITGAPVI